MSQEEKEVAFTPSILPGLVTMTTALIAIVAMVIALMSSLETSSRIEEDISAIIYPLEKDFSLGLSPDYTAPEFNVNGIVKSFIFKLTKSGSNLLCQENSSGKVTARISFKNDPGEYSYKSEFDTKCEYLIRIIEKPEENISNKNNSGD